MSRPSAIGMEAVRRQQQYIQDGVRSPSRAAELALRDMYAEASQSQYQQQQTAAQAQAAQQAKVQAGKVAFQKAGAAKSQPSPARKPAAPEAVLSSGKRGITEMLEKRFAERGHKVKEDVAA